MAKVTDREIDEIASAVMGATRNAEAGRTTYLQTLLATTQEELEHKRGVEPAVQLVALRRVHERFYAIVLTAAGRLVPRNHPNRPQELQRLANFARTALSALRGHVRAGGDLATLTPGKVSKGVLRARAGPKRPPTARRLRNAATRSSKRLMTSLMALADSDKEAAVSEIQLLMGQLADQLVRLGVTATRDAAQAADKGMALRIGKTLFMPTTTQVIAQQARPS